MQTLLAEQDGIRMVGADSSGARINERVSRAGPDVVVVDIGLSKEIEPARRGRTVVLLPASPGDELLKSCVSGGFRGLVTRDAGVDEMLRAVKAVRAGHAYVDTVVADWLLRPAGRSSQWEHSASAGFALTERESSVLGFLADGMSNSEIADRMSIAVRTVKYHVSHLRDKLGARDRAHTVALAYRAGYSSRS